MEKHHSCLNTRAVIEYFQENFPEEIGRLLEGLEPEIQALPDPVGFLMETTTGSPAMLSFACLKTPRKLPGMITLSTKWAQNLQPEKNSAISSAFCCLPIETPAAA